MLPKPLLDELRDVYDERDYRCPAGYILRRREWAEKGGESCRKEGCMESCEVMKREIKYVPGEWFKAGTIEEMQAFYMSRLPAIREAARAHGYAIGLHGSARRDFDLMAMQWRDGASDKDTLAHSIAVAACGITQEGAYRWEQKPCGRWAVSMCVCWTDHANPDFKDKLSVGHIDLSVIDFHTILRRAR